MALTRSVSYQDLAKKSVIVTGGANGIGKSIVQAFLQQGSHVTFCDFNGDEGAATLASFHTEHPDCVQFIECDVQSKTSLMAVFEAAKTKYGAVDILVNNAAAFVFGEIQDVDDEDWSKAINTNIKGYAHSMALAVRVMREQGSGAIVNLASISSFIAQPAFVPYNTTKGAIMQMSKCVAMDVGKHGIRVNCVSPGPILTEATRRHAKATGQTIEGVVSSMQDHMILKRLGDTSEVAAAVLFLASAQASFITGTNLMVDGGYLAT